MAYSRNQSWSERQFEAIGVPYPPPKGWPAMVVGKEITNRNRRIFENGWDRRKKPRRKAIKVKKTKGWRQRLCNMPGAKFYRTKTWFALRRRVIEEYGYKCMLCGSLDDIQVDHIQPRSRAPHLSLTFSNLQVLCKDCNRQKSNIHAEDYREESIAEDIDRETWLTMKELGL